SLDLYPFWPLQINRYGPRCEEWARRLYRADLLGEANEHKWACAVVCSLHFTDEMYSCPRLRQEPGMQLLTTAFPTRNLYKAIPPVLQRKSPTVRGEPLDMSPRKDAPPITVPLPKPTGRRVATMQQLRQKLKVERNSSARLRCQNDTLKRRCATSSLTATRLRNLAQHNCVCAQIASMSETAYGFHQE
ncbi:hypothetical protein BOX15_Mlig030330g1, partial [Macrostomum lignano]